MVSPSDRCTGRDCRCSWLIFARAGDGPWRALGPIADDQLWLEGLSLCTYGYQILVRRHGREVWRSPVGGRQKE